MSKTYMPDIVPDQRLELLRANCDSMEETKYYKELTPDELDIKREELTTNLIQLSEWEDELTGIKDDFKARMKPLKDVNNDLLGQVKTRKELCSGKLFHFADHTNGLMETFDERGEFVSSRRLRPEERQQKLFSVPKTANE